MNRLCYIVCVTVLFNVWSGDEKFVGAALCDDGLYRGHEYVNHPTPSGCARWLPSVSDTRGWPTCEIAIAELRKSLEYPEPKPEVKVKLGLGARFRNLFRRK